MPELWDAIDQAQAPPPPPNMWGGSPADAITIRPVSDVPQKPVPTSLWDAISNVGQGLTRDVGRGASALWEALNRPQMYYQPAPDMWNAPMGVGSPAEAAGAPSAMGSLAGGLYQALGDISKKAFGASEEMRTQGTYNPAPILDAAMLPMGTGGITGLPLKAGEVALGAGAVRGTRPAAEAVAEARPGLGHNMPPPEYPAPTGSLNPLDNVPVTFRGKEPKDFTPQDWQAFGEHYGADNIGPLSPLQTFKDMNGKEFQIPGGTEGTWTYLDALHMKANPINPANVDRELHTAMQQKLGRTMTPKELSDADVWNGLIFGMTSPNNPLFPNQATASRLRLRTPQMLDDLASMIPWKAGETPTKQQRKIVNDAIANRYGLGGASKTGGLGTRGTADYSRVGEMAQLFKEKPEFFRKKPDETWTQAVERISSQLPGLSMKTGSFGTVWQDPAKAAISAIDRHMARELDKKGGGIFENAKERNAWEKRSVDLWNSREYKRVIADQKKAEKTGSTREIPTADIASSFEDMLKKSGSDGFVGEMLLDHVGKALTPKFRIKTGDVNPKIPEHLAKADWAKEPKTVFKVGRAYKRALEVNQKIADEHGLNLFMSQWMEWDRIRNRFEPHENMFPGLSKLPAMSVEQMREVDAAHRATGHKTYGKNPEGSLKPTRPLQGSPSRMGYLGLAATAGGAGALAPGLFGDNRQ